MLGESLSKSLCHIRLEMRLNVSTKFCHVAGLGETIRKNEANSDFRQTTPSKSYWNLFGGSEE